jgi:hypothetical protein
MAWHEPRFDQHQFGGRRSNAVNARKTREGWDTTGIAFSDLQLSMHVQRRQKVRERRLETPKWAVNDTELLAVVLNLCERRLYLKPDPSVVTDKQRAARIRKTELEFCEKRWKPLLRKMYDRLKDETDPYLKTKLSEQIQNVDSCIMMARRSSIAVMVAVVYFYYRNGWDSVKVGEELKLHPPHVRQILARLYWNGVKGAFNYEQRVAERQLGLARLNWERTERIFARVARATKRHNQWLEEKERRAMMRQDRARVRAMKWARIQEERRLRKIRRSPEAAEALFARIELSQSQLSPIERKCWNQERMTFIDLLLHLKKESWTDIAKRIGYTFPGNLSKMYKFFRQNPHRLLPEVKKANQRAAGLAIMSRPEVRAKVSEANLRVWLDPEKRERRLGNMRRACSTPEYRRKVGEASRKFWAQPGARASNSAANKLAQSKPEVRAKKSASSKAFWENNPELRVKRSAQKKAWWATRKANAASGTKSHPAEQTPVAASAV